MSKSPKTKFDINTATKSELKSHYKIGAISAKRIIAYREQLNRKMKISDLKDIKKINQRAVKLVSDSALEVKHPKNTEQKNIKRTKSKHHISVRGKASRLEVLLPREELSDQDKVAISFAKGKLRDKYGNELDQFILNKSTKRNLKKDLSFKLPISKHTKPGSYSTTIIAGNKEFKTVIEVLESQKAKVSPRSFELSGSVRKCKKSLVIYNTGNMPLTIKDPGAISLEIDQIECRTTRSTVHEIRRKKGKVGFEDFIDIATKKLTENYKEAGVMKVTVVGGKLIIPPGESRKVEFEFQLPASLKSNIYTGIVKIYNTGVKIRIN